jgi:hypothetical protein
MKWDSYRKSSYNWGKILYNIVLDQIYNCFQKLIRVSGVRVFTAELLAVGLYPSKIFTYQVNLWLSFGITIYSDLNFWSYCRCLLPLKYLFPVKPIINDTSRCLSSTEVSTDVAVRLSVRTGLLRLLTTLTDNLIFVHSFNSLSYDRSKAFSKASSPHTDCGSSLCVI